MNYYMFAVIGCLGFVSCVDGSVKSKSSKNTETVEVKEITTPTVEVEKEVSKPEPKVKHKIQKPDITDRAGKFLKAYEENQVFADKNLKGKRLAAKGKVESVVNGILDGIDVSINDGNQFDITAITCNFSKDTPNLDTLKKGQEVFLIGDCDGGTTIGITLNNCDLVIPKKK
jgi:hypothetical protein